MKRLARRRITIRHVAELAANPWSRTRTRPPVPEVRKALFDLHEKGSIKPVIYKRYSLDEVPVALSELGSRKTYGKLIITP